MNSHRTVTGIDYNFLIAHFDTINKTLADEFRRSQIVLAALYPNDDESQRDIAAIPSLVWC